jgi:hypothetical protein
LAIFVNIFKMNTNHFDVKVVYPLKVGRLSRNIALLEEAAAILEGLPLKIVQAHWRRVSEKDLS